MGRLLLQELPSVPLTIDRDYSETVDIGGGLIIHRWLGLEYEPEGPDDELPYSVQVWAEYRLEKSAYEIENAWVNRVDGGPAVDSNNMRTVPFATLLRGMGRLAVVAWPDASYGEYPDNMLPRDLEDGGYTKIAAVHRLHDALGNRPTKAVADHFAVSRGTAAKWVRELRDRGLIPAREESDTE